MTNICINLLLIKFRQQYGLRLFAAIFLSAYVVVTAAHLFVHGFASAVAVRAVSGMAAGGAEYAGALLHHAGLSGEMAAEGAGGRHRRAAARRADGAAVLARSARGGAVARRSISSSSGWPSLVARGGGWRCACRRANAKRHSSRSISSPSLLFAAGMALLCAVLGQGRIQWWTEAAWMGWALAAAIPLIAAALAIEHGRAHPLLDTRWLGSADIVRFAVVSVMARIVLSEQTFAAVGLLNTLGLNNDQLGPLFVIILLASIAGHRGERNHARCRASGAPGDARDRAGGGRRVLRFARDQPDRRAANVCDAGRDRVRRDLFPRPGAVVRHDAGAGAWARAYRELSSRYSALPIRSAGSAARPC